MKETTTEKYIKKAVKMAKEELAGNTIQSCNFHGVEYSEEFVETVSAIADAIHKNAEACLKNAEALCNIAEVFKSSNVNIESMVKIEG